MRTLIPAIRKIEKQVTEQDFHEWKLVFIDETLLSYVEHNMVGDELILAELVLVDPDCKIEQGDLVYRFADEKFFISQHPFTEEYNGGLLGKVVASTSEETVKNSIDNSLLTTVVGITRLSDNSIKTLMKYFNTYHGNLPEWVKAEISVEFDEKNKIDEVNYYQSGTPKYEITEYREQFYSAGDMFSYMQYYMEYCQENGYVTPHVWLRDKKHF